jgi:hypothetical protein
MGELKDIIRVLEDFGFRMSARHLKSALAEWEKDRRNLQRLFDFVADMPTGFDELIPDWED